MKKSIQIFVFSLVMLLAYQNCGEIKLDSSSVVESSCANEVKTESLFIEPVLVVNSANDLNFAVFEELELNVRQSSNNFKWIVKDLATGEVKYYENQNVLTIAKPAANECLRLDISAEFVSCEVINRIPSEIFQSIGCEETPEPPPIELPEPEPPPGGTALDSCEEIRESTTDPLQLSLIEPEGYQQQVISWEKAFSHPDNIRHFPDTVTAPWPVGSWTLSPKDAALNVTQHIPMKGKYISIPFIADTQQQHKLEWIGAVALSYLPPYRPHPATINYVTISTCAGDFRTTSQFVPPANDLSLSATCRSIGRGSDGSRIYFGTRTTGCQVTPGKKYYINIVFADPSDGLDPLESSCNLTSGYIQDGEAARGVCDSAFWMRY